MSSREIHPDDQLWELSVEQAQEVLDAFLKTEREAFQTLEIDHIELDYSSQSVIRSAHHIASEIKAGRLNEAQQKLWFMRLGYYFGESLRQASPRLSWGLGDPDYALANHPVVKGFTNGQEAAVITICRNIIRSVAEDRFPPIRIDNAINHWFDFLT